MADTQVLEACAERREGSSPSIRTNVHMVEWQTRWSQKPESFTGREGSSPSMNTSKSSWRNGIRTRLRT
jgi:hypothetical protein